MTPTLPYVMSGLVYLVALPFAPFIGIMAVSATGASFTPFCFLLASRYRDS